MTLYEMWNYLISIPGAKTVLVIIVLSLVEICPVKINPWSWIGELIGKLVGIKKVSEKMDAIDKKVDDLDQKVDGLDRKVEENDTVSSRVRILRFASEIMDKRFHNKDSWDQTMIDVAKYERYVSEHPSFKNGITEPTIEYIKEQYKERLERNDWDRKND